MREAKRSKRTSYFELIRSNGGSCNGCVEYTQQFSQYEDALAELNSIFEQEEEYCASHQGAWHLESLYEVTVNGYGDEVKRELLRLTLDQIVLLIRRARCQNKSQGHG